jgi:ornithine carbamoyltransferase
MSARHFLKLSDLSAAELQSLIDRAVEMKVARQSGRGERSCNGRVLAMVFEKASTRTRVSFETAMAHLGGHAVFLSPADSQLGRGEPPADTARVLSQMVDCIMVRTHGHARLIEFAAAASVPVINGLSDAFHPCQLLADLQTIVEQRGAVRGIKVAWVGDGNNMCNTWIEAASLMDFRLAVACPERHDPQADLLAAAGSRVTLTRDPREAVDGADVVVTDVWASMGQEEEATARREAFRAFQVNAGLMSLAARQALFLHCLPAHRGEEVTAEIIDGPHSVVWEEAGNRLHAQKALLEFLLR